MKPLALFFKGILMGTADIIPGISGGTVALILGIYERFIHALAQVSLKPLLQFRVKDFLQTIDWLFFVPLGLGIISAIFSLSHFLSWLLENYPLYVWSLFFGLVFTSVIYLIIKYRCHQIAGAIFIAIGAVFGLLIASSSSIQFPENPLFLFFGGVLASMAMILPGISGSYILVLIGQYGLVLGYVKTLAFIPILIFGSGVATGILFGSRILKSLFARYPLQIYSILFGFILGSLPKIWPWHSVSEGLSLPQIQSAQDIQGLLIMGIGATFVVVSMRFAKKK